MSEARSEYRNRSPSDYQRRGFVSKARTMLYSVCILCGTAIVIAVTIKVIMSLFS